MLYSSMCPQLSKYLYTKYKIKEHKKFHEIKAHIFLVPLRDKNAGIPPSEQEKNVVTKTYLSLEFQGKKACQMS